MPERVHKITSMGVTAPSEPNAESSGGDSGRADVPAQPSGLDRGIDLVLSIQRPVVVAHIRSIRRRAPQATPDELIRMLERRYLAAVTTGGAAVGATAVIPGIGTGVTLALSGVETAGFLEATALFAQSVAEVHGIAVENPARARALVMTLMLGREGVDLVRQFAGQAGGRGVARDAYWGELITNGLPRALVGPVADQLRATFIKHFAVKGGAGIIGKALPFGIGAAIGGTGNHLLGRKVLQQSRLAFGQAPAALPLELEPGDSPALAQAAASGVMRAAAAFGAVAVSTSRGLREVAARAVRRDRRRIESTDAAASVPEPEPEAAGER
ncbi:hypothetical protein SAMN05428970_1777 [Agromyces sp. CF514]|uniref:hypothetical protein n=1 Tax=Agromyces sp. CF514 TaxID=1881031 RepID=UPI0008E8E0D1|nr:hypothetical protein [Agromyces sp. CF514]SFR74719.1 hypothetical protein SAMN05428970_1777 [Agromyces sp. CF514]